MANGVIDTVMAGRLSAADLAAVGLGASIYISVYIGANGVLLALSPIIAQHFGAGRLGQVGAEVRQGLLLAAVLSAVGGAVLVWHGPFIALGSPPPEVAARTSLYLYGVAAGLPAALAFRVFHGLNTAISRPKAVMAVNLAGLALKVPLNALFMFGFDADSHGLPASMSVPAMGGAGCAMATAVISWISAAVALAMLRAPTYRAFALAGSWRPEPARLLGLLRLGLPTGASYMIEVTAFAFISIFVARLGATVAASQQVAANLVGVAYMFPLAVAHATGVLAAQAIGAGDPRHARQVALHGTGLSLLAGVAIGALLFAFRHSVAGAYADDPEVIATAVGLIVLVAAYVPFDAVQVAMAFALRAWRVATLPMAIYAVSLWGIGLGGGWWLAYGPQRLGTRLGLEGAQPFWAAAVVSVMVAACGLAWLLVRVLRQVVDQPVGSAAPRPAPDASPPAAPPDAGAGADAGAGTGTGAVAMAPAAAASAAPPTMKRSR